MIAQDKYILLDADNSTGNFVLCKNGEHIAEFYNEEDAANILSLLEKSREA